MANGIVNVHPGTRIVLACGYDLITLALQQCLQQAGFNPTSVPLEDCLNGSVGHPRILIVDDAALSLLDFATMLTHLQQALPDTQLVIIDSDCDPHRIVQAAQAGVAGYLYLGDRLRERLVTLVLDVLQGSRHYSPRVTQTLSEALHLREEVLPRLNEYHRQVLWYMCQHWNAARIGAALGRSRHAIYQTQRHLREMFDAESNSALVLRVTAWDLMP